MASADLTGKKFGRLLVIGRSAKKDGKHAFWECLCDCGRTCVRETSVLKRYGENSQCAQWDHDKLGKRYGRLTVIDYAGSNKHGKAKYLCRCDCGNTTIATGTELANGQTVSCGCWQRESMAKYRAKDQVDGTALHSIKSKPRKNNTSGIVGVHWNKRARMWQAYIRLRGKNHHLGWFKHFEDAAEARREAEQEIFDPELEAHGLEPTSEEEYQERLRKAIEKNKHK